MAGKVWAFLAQTAESNQHFLTHIAAPAGSPLWGRVEWTSVGATLVADRAYRYLSPVFLFDAASGEILEIVCAGLTNKAAKTSGLPASTKVTGSYADWSKVI